MMNQGGKASKARPRNPGDGVAGPARGPSVPDPGRERENAVRRPQPDVELDLADLIGDANGEVVFFNDSAVRTVGLSTDAAVVAHGRSGCHVTAGGTDVSDCRYVAFDNGLTLYYGNDVELIVRQRAEDGHR